ncbi:hypothetical protein [Bacillus sp. V3B]|nr:hypothetical protein [Bacillus sp. V3B]
MNKHNTIFTEAELQAILAEFNYVDSARKCTVSTLIIEKGFIQVFESFK